MQLVYFNRFSLEAGKQDFLVEFEIEAQQMAVWTDEGWVVPNGELDLSPGKTYSRVHSLFSYVKYVQCPQR